MSLFSDNDLSKLSLLFHDHGTWFIKKKKNKRNSINKRTDSVNKFYYPTLQSTTGNFQSSNDKQKAYCKLFMQWFFFSVCYLSR